MRPVPLLEAIAITAAVALLAMSVLFARTVRGTGQSRIRRTILPAMTVVLGAALVMGLPSLFFRPPLFAVEEFGWGVLFVALAAFVSVAIGDAVAGIVGAERTQRWLGAGIVAAILLTYFALALLSAGFIFGLGPLAITPALVAASAVIVWWPYLPAPEGEGEDDEAAAEVFE